MNRSTKAPRTAAIPGAVSGLAIARAVALKLAGTGYRVFGTATTTEEVDCLALASGRQVSLSITDITHEEAVRTWGHHVGGQLGDTGLDVLVGNAGNGEWDIPRVLQVQFDGIAGHGIDQFRSGATQLTVSPPDLAAAALRYPYTGVV